MSSQAEASLTRGEALGTVDTAAKLEPYMHRVVRSDHFRRGVATGAVSILVACAIEALWPST